MQDIVNTVFLTHVPSQTLRPIAEARGETLREQLATSLKQSCWAAAPLVRPVMSSHNTLSDLMLHHSTQAADAAVEISNKFADGMYWSTYRGSEYHWYVVDRSILIITQHSVDMAHGAIMI